MWFFDRFTPSGRGRRDGKYWRVIHDRLGVERWEGEALLEAAKQKAVEDYVGHALADVRHHSGYIYNFILAYTAKPKRSTITDELLGNVKDAPEWPKEWPIYDGLPAPRVDERLIGHD